MEFVSFGQDEPQQQTKQVETARVSGVEEVSGRESARNKAWEKIRWWECGYEDSDHPDESLLTGTTGELHGIIPKR